MNNVRHITSKLHHLSSSSAGAARLAQPVEHQTLNLRVMSSSPILCKTNRPRSIYQYPNMVPRLSGQTSIFGVVVFVSKSLLEIEGQRKLEKFAILTWKPRSHAQIYWYIERGLLWLVTPTIVMKHAFILFNLEGWTNRQVTDKEIDAQIQRQKDEREY